MSYCQDNCNCERCKKQTHIEINDVEILKLLNRKEYQQIVFKAGYKNRSERRNSGRKPIS